MLAERCTSFAHWVVLLLGWVWLGEQGQRLGWSLAGGVGAVALWWGLRVLLVQRMAGRGWPLRAPLVLGVVTAAGALWIGQGSHAGLLVVAVLWGLWSAALQARRPRAPLGLEAVLAALLVWAAVFHPLPGLWPGSGVALVLLLAALASGAGGAERRGATADDALPQTAMGLMMGSLWLGSAWCSGAAPGGSSANGIGLHLLLMTALPLIWRAGRLPLAAPALARPALVLLACAALWAGGSPWLGLGAMALLALACTLTPPHRPGPANPGQRATALLGPALLLAVGLGSAALGPQALQRAYGLLAGLALAGMVGLAAQMLQRRRAARARPARAGGVSI